MDQKEMMERLKERVRIIHIKDGVIGKIEQNIRHDASPFGEGTIMK